VENIKTFEMENRDYLDKTTRKWWFFFLLLLLQGVLLPFASENFSFQGMGDMIQVTLRSALTFSLKDYYIFFQLFSLVILLLLLICKKRFGAVFSAYVAFEYFFFAVIQNVAVTPRYGISIVTVNVVMMGLVGCVWIKEALSPRSSYRFANLNWGTAWLIPLALFAYWLPVNTTDLGFDFSLDPFLYNGSALAFCTMTPVFLTIMILNIPDINVGVYRLTAVVGFIIGLYNLGNFADPYTLNLGLVHLPLLLISFYALISSFFIKCKSK
jgi:hypothetical protein